MYELTQNAKNLLATRGIGQNNINAVIISGTFVPDCNPGILRYSLEDLVVICDVRRQKVVTAFYMKKTKKKKEYK